MKAFDASKVFLSRTNLASRICLLDPDLRREMESSNFWTAGNFQVQNCVCSDISSESIRLEANCIKQNKQIKREVIIPFPSPITSEDMLKNTLVLMANSFGCLDDTAAIIKLPFGRDYTLPPDFRFNDVPHAAWFRSYMYDSVKNAAVKAIKDFSFRMACQSKMQIKVNFPEG